MLCVKLSINHSNVHLNCPVSSFHLRNSTTEFTISSSVFKKSAKVQAVLVFTA